MRRPADGPDPGSELAHRSNLTSHQLLMWLAHELYSGAPLHNLAGVFTLPGRIEVTHFRRAFQTLVDSSDALRTVIEEVHGAPRQRVLPAVRRAIDYVDMSAAPDPEAAADAWVRARAQTRLTLSECLYDAALIKVGEARFAWFLHVHHAVFDGGSSLLMARLLAAATSSLSPGPCRSAWSCRAFTTTCATRSSTSARPTARRACVLEGAPPGRRRAASLLRGHASQDDDHRHAHLPRAHAGADAATRRAGGPGGSLLSSHDHVRHLRLGARGLPAPGQRQPPALHRGSVPQPPHPGPPRHARAGDAGRAADGRIHDDDTFLSLLRRIEADSPSPGSMRRTRSRRPSTSPPTTPFSTSTPR